MPYKKVFISSQLISFSSGGRAIMIRKLSVEVSFLTSWSRLVSEIKFHACYEAIKKRGWVYYFSNILQNSCMQSAQLFKHVAESNKI